MLQNHKVAVGGTVRLHYHRERTTGRHELIKAQAIANYLCWNFLYTHGLGVHNQLSLESVILTQIESFCSQWFLSNRVTKYCNPSWTRVVSFTQFIQFWMKLPDNRLTKTYINWVVSSMGRWVLPWKNRRGFREWKGAEHTQKYKLEKKIQYKRWHSKCVNCNNVISIRALCVL